MSNSFDKRLARTQDIVPVERLSNRLVEVVGVGGIGRQVALQLATMGVQNLKIVDGDTVEEHNLGVQGFLEEDLGKHKVHAVADMISRINSSVNVEACPNMFKRSDKSGSIVFCCVDTMSARKMIWETIKNNIELYVDGRMLGLTGRILTVFDGPSMNYYNNPSNLFTDEEASEGRCTEKSTIFLANFAAALMVNVLARWMRNKWMGKEFPMEWVQNLTFDLATPHVQVYGG